MLVSMTAVANVSYVSKPNLTWLIDVDEGLDHNGIVSLMRPFDPFCLAFLRVHPPLKKSLIECYNKTISQQLNKAHHSAKR